MNGKPAPQLWLPWTIEGNPSEEETTRFIQPAVMQVLQAQWDPTFSDSRFGFRPGRNAHQAVKRA